MIRFLFMFAASFSATSSRHGGKTAAVGHRLSVSCGFRWVQRPQFEWFEVRVVYTTKENI